MGRVHSARASVGRGTCGACKLSTRLPQSEFPSEGNQFELGLYEEPRTPLWLSQRQTLERLRHGDPGCGDDRRHEDFDFADADEVDAIAAKMTSLSVGDSSLTSLERTWPRQRSLWRSARDLDPGRRTKTRQNRTKSSSESYSTTTTAAATWRHTTSPSTVPIGMGKPHLTRRHSPNSCLRWRFQPAVVYVGGMCARMCYGAFLAGAGFATASYSQKVTAPA